MTSVTVEPGEPVFTRPVLTLLVNSLLSSLSGFLVTPFLAVYLVDTGSIGLGSAGVYIGVIYWCLTGGAVFGGMLADRFGVKMVMILGLLLRVPGYLLFLWVGNPVVLLAACVVTGLGGALFFPTSKAALVILTNERSRLRVLAARNMLANAGVALGPLLGALLLTISPSLLFVSAAGVFAGLAVSCAFLTIPKSPTMAASVSRLFGVLASRTGAAVCVISVVFGLAYIHFESTIPLYLGQMQRTGFLSGMFVINAVVVVVTQPIATQLVKRYSATTCFVLGLMMYAVGYACFLSAAVPIWIAGTLVFSFGEVVVTLTLDIHIAAVSQGRSVQLFGVSGLASAFGGIAGGWAGSALLNVWAGSSAWHSWIVIAPATIVSAVAAGALFRRLQATAQSATPGGD
jgi:MFS family permease